MPNASFNATPAEARAIRDIAKRAMTLSTARQGDPFTKLDIAMDITAAHCNGCPLRLEALRDANNLDFAHDVLGIRRFLDRTTGKLPGEFHPRFAQRSQ